MAPVPISKPSFLDSCEYLGVFLDVKSRNIIDILFEQLGLFLGPVFHRLKGRNVAQCFLRDVLIVDFNVAFDGIGQVLGGVEAGGG